MFERKKITVPADGVTATFSMKGFGVVIESIPIYTEPEQVPLMYFNSKGNKAQPLYPQSKYPSEEKIQRVIIEGTSESDGDEIFLLLTPFCLEPDINILLATEKEITVAPGTRQQASTDVVQTLSNAQLVNADGDLPIAMAVSANGAGIHYAIGADPNQSENGHVLTDGADAIRIEGVNLITDFRFISAVAATPGTLNYTCEF